MPRPGSSHSICAVATVVLLVTGCSSSDAPSVPDHAQSSSAESTSITSEAEPREAPKATADAGERGGERPRSLSDLLIGSQDHAAGDQQESGAKVNVSSNSAAAGTVLQVDADALRSQGIRTLFGKHITIYTDLPASDVVDGLPQIFDLAVPQWARYFHVAAADVSQWHVYGILMSDPDKFRAVQLLTDDVPPFLHGYQQGDRFWAYEQPSDYYLRHIVLHEGTHAFMNNVMGGAGPPWYMEGVAELMATHHWDGTELTLRYMPKTNEEVPYWGRLKIIRDKFAASEALMLADVMRLEHSAFMEVDAYAWAWAAAAFLDGHPAYQARFRGLRNYVKDDSQHFTRRFENQLVNQLRQVDEEWQLFVMHAEYGYDFKRAAVQYREGDRLPPGGADVEVTSQRGWQSSGYRLEAGQSYQITASGRFQVGAEEGPWWSEANGITLHYYQGRPLGMLVGNVRFDQAVPGIANLGRPVPLGVARQVRPEKSGTLYLRINESPAGLADNEGVLHVHIRPVDATADGTLPGASGKPDFP
ncbi:MAG: hypothetical protein KDA60_20425 [Planctomycetales bacterium]|nr:hypothetical protein [Planctomycetales bacterium]